MSSAKKNVLHVLTNDGPISPVCMFYTLETSYLTSSPEQTPCKGRNGRESLNKVSTVELQYMLVTNNLITPVTL